MCVTTSGRQMLSCELTPPRSMKPNEQPLSSRDIDIRLHLATVGVRFCTTCYRHAQHIHHNVTHTCAQTYGTGKPMITYFSLHIYDVMGLLCVMGLWLFGTKSCIIVLFLMLWKINWWWWYICWSCKNTHEIRMHVWSSKLCTDHNSCHWATRDPYARLKQ